MKSMSSEIRRRARRMTDGRLGDDEQGGYSPCTGLPECLSPKFREEGAGLATVAGPDAFQLRAEAAGMLELAIREERRPTPLEISSPGARVVLKQF